MSAEIVSLSIAALRVAANSVYSDKAQRRVQEAIDALIAAQDAEALCAMMDNERVRGFPVKIPQGGDPCQEDAPALPKISAIPDAIGPDDGENPDYMDGWNDFREKIILMWSNS